MKKSEINRLTMSYLAVIMTLSLIFTGIIYMLATASLNRPLTMGEDEGVGSSLNTEFEDHTFENMFEKRLERRDNSTRTSIVVSLMGFNIGVFLVGIFVSRNLAKLTLAPIERAMMRQTQFIFDASHELKTPLTAMLIRNEVALRKKNLPEEKAREVIEKNIEEIQRMKELTGSMLAVAREGGEKEGENEVVISDFIEGLREKMAPVAENRGMEIKTEVKIGKVAKARVAEKTLEQILTVFIDNAIKYSGDEVGVHGDAKRQGDTGVYSDAEGGVKAAEKTIYLRAMRRGKNLFFSVKDSGIGIKKEEQKRIFERFYQVDEARTRTGDKTSHGLGLAIAKNLAERQGYRIILRSAEGAGAEFEVGV